MRRMIVLHWSGASSSTSFVIAKVLSAMDTSALRRPMAAVGGEEISIILVVEGKLSAHNTM